MFSMNDRYVDYPNAPFPVLVSGIHTMSLSNFEEEFVYNDHRRVQYEGLVSALSNLKASGCVNVYIDGSYVTRKPFPGDYDACVDYTTVDVTKLDPVFYSFDNLRREQKEKYLGEFFPHNYFADDQYLFLEFFQREKYSGERKGIVHIDLRNEEFDNLGGAE
ncbi:DUF6932 family protein [Photobacterium leiognathi]|uniref:DUF6932 family protein n=1 Tax=Photobacterium leiognathi TaxID=553611 RepID=UPI00298274FD|nr:hypothetical protein [Photobacterium leiognathi]